MTRCQRTNVGYAATVARWLQRHGAQLLVDDRIEDQPTRYWLAPGVTSADIAFPQMPHTPPDGALARYRTVEHFGMAIETPGGVAWT